MFMSFKSFIRPNSKITNCLFQKSLYQCSPSIGISKFAWMPPMDKSKKPIVNNKDLYAHNSTTLLDYISSLNINAKITNLRLSSIICTIGPALASVEKLETMIESGMNIARLNFSHGTHDYHLNTVNNLREAVENYSKKIDAPYPLAIALDTKGPEIRTGVIDGENGTPKEVKLNKGEKIRLLTDRQFEKSCSNKQVFVDYENITKIVNKDDRLYVDDGLILLRAVLVGDNYIDCVIENDGVLGSRKGINLPGLDVDLPAVSEKDKVDLKFAVDNDLDMVFASFVREASAVNEIRNILGEQGKNILVVPKIENHQGIKNIKSIIDVSDGIMVARGDLGIEIPPEKVFLVQKSILAQCNISGKPGICATQMLESMIKKPRATRAESSDVANAILDGADCVMLSGETAKGDYPVECVRTMDKLCREAESAFWRKRFFYDLASKLIMRNVMYEDKYQELAIFIVSRANELGVAAIIVNSQDIRKAQTIAKYRPRAVILAVTNDHKVARQCHLYRGILPVLYTETGNCDNLNDLNKKCLQYTKKFGKKQGILSPGDTIIFVKENTNSTNIIDL